MTRRFASIASSTAVGLVALVGSSNSTLAAAAQVAPCALSGSGHVQICPVAFKATVRTASRVTVARYSDFSHCNLPAPSGEPGDNTHYTVASVTINWGDGTRPTSGVAHTATTCPGADSTTPGANEPVTGAHRYKKPGTYAVSVSLTYVRGSGNTYQNCAIATAGSTVYNKLTNCIALNAPVHSIGIIKKKH